MTVMTFGTSERKPQAYDVIQIGVQSRDGQREEMELNCTPLICQPLTAQPMGGIHNSKTDN